MDFLQGVISNVVLGLQNDNNQLGPNWTYVRFGDGHFLFENGTPASGVGCSEHMALLNSGKSSS